MACNKELEEGNYLPGPVAQLVRALVL
ncbi:hypothetical protein CCACVL1_02470 [Corchorus capsularis]|uniref:Uncharacterized protein n=1 Tax=Corchorus capsularis TaxID=210143 RepID=A0A1R3K8F9_COCAP|nr:hypothetical protein CCACVL1_02470 [Corchorus capsularis]